MKNHPQSLGNDPRESALGYDRLAAYYQGLELLAFGRSLQRARVALLDHLPSSRNALFLGDGDGRLLQAFHEHQPGCRVTTVDHSFEMLRKQKQRLQPFSDTDAFSSRCQDLRQFTPEPAEYDLLVAAFVLDCFTPTELAEHLGRWLSALTPDGFFYFVDFVEPKKKLCRVRASVYQRVMHGFFRWQTMLPNVGLVNLPKFLGRQPLHSIRSVRSGGEMLISTLYCAQGGGIDSWKQ